jgi:hypothetical protein
MAIAVRHLSASAQKHGPMVAVAPSQNHALQTKGVRVTSPILAKTEIVWSTPALGAKTHVPLKRTAGLKAAEKGIGEMAPGTCAWWVAIIAECRMRLNEVTMIGVSVLRPRVANSTALCEGSSAQNVIIPVTCIVAPISVVKVIATCSRNQEIKEVGTAPT